MALTEREIQAWAKFAETFAYLVDLKDKVVQEYQRITTDLNSDVDRLSLGTSGVFLNSILSNLRAVELTLEHGYIEAAGEVAASLWEKCITLIYILNEPLSRSEEHSTHRGLRRTPWSVRTMVRDIVRREELSRSRNRNVEEELLYFQYSFLCAIKHGHPLTISYLNRLRETDARVIDLKPDVADEDKGLVAWLYSISVTTSLDALVAFAKAFCIEERCNELKRLQHELATTVMSEGQKRKYKLPLIILPAEGDFSPEYIEHLRKINSLYLDSENGHFS